VKQCHRELLSAGRLLPAVLLLTRPCAAGSSTTAVWSTPAPSRRPSGEPSHTFSGSSLGCIRAMARSCAASAASCRVCGPALRRRRRLLGLGGRRLRLRRQLLLRDEVRRDAR